MAAEFLTLPSAKMRDLQDQVIKHRDEARASRGDAPLLHSDRYRRFLADLSLRPPGPWPDAPAIFVPMTRSIHERLHAEIWQALFATLNQITLQPFGEEDLHKSEVATRFLRWTLTKTIPFTSISSMLVFDALMDSVGVAKVMTWTPPWSAPRVDRRRFLNRSVRIDPIDLSTLLVAPDAEGLQYPECRYVAQEFFLSKDDLFRMEDAGYDVPTHPDQLGHAQQMTERKQVELEREGESVVEFRPDSIEFMESYERFPVDSRLEEDVIVSWFPEAPTDGTSKTGRIAGVRRLIDVFPQDDRPRRPLFPVTVWPQPRQWRGLNVPDRLQTMQDLINRLHEQLINYGDVSMLPYVFANTFLTGELPDLRSVPPGSVVPIDDLSGVQFAPTRSLNRHFAEQIQLAQASVERDVNISDFTLGRQPDRANAPRTASATLAILGESRKSFSMLVRHNAVQFSDMLNFYFRLWQEILPPETYAQIAPPSDVKFPQSDAPESQEESPGLFSRLFEEAPQTFSRSPRLVAVPIQKEELSGFFDVVLEVNPEEAFDRQVMLSLFQLIAPILQQYPLGMRTMLKRIWGSFDQHGFDDIYPEWLAALQTQQQMLAAQVGIATLQGQLQQIQAAEQQAQLQALQGSVQGGGGLGALLGGGATGGPSAAPANQGGAVSPQFLQTIAALLQQTGAGATNGAR